MNEKLEVALTALADALAELPAKDIVFEWLNGGRLVDEVALMLEGRYPAKAAEMNAAFQDWKDRARRSRKPSGRAKSFARIVAVNRQLQVSLLDAGVQTWQGRHR